MAQWVEALVTQARQPEFHTPVFYVKVGESEPTIPSSDHMLGLAPALTHMHHSCT